MTTKGDERGFRYSLTASGNSLDDLFWFCADSAESLLPFISPASRERIEQGAKRDAANRSATIHGSGVDITFRDLD